MFNEIRDQSRPRGDVWCAKEQERFARKLQCPRITWADAFSQETMKVWHHLWHSLGTTQNPIQCLILLNTEYTCTKKEKRLKYGLLASQDHSKLPTSLQRAQRAVHWTDATPLRPGPIAEILNNTLRNREREQFTDKIPVRIARERMLRAARHCHKHWVSRVT